MTGIMKAPKRGMRRCGCRPDLESAHYDLDIIADGILINEERYRDVMGNTGVPWYWIGAIHSREVRSASVAICTTGIL